MSRTISFRSKAVRTEDPGIGTSFEKPLDRVLGRDGNFTVRRVGQLSGLREGFTALATMGTGRLVGTFVFGYLTMNLIFGSMYMLVGVENIGNANMSTMGSKWMTAIGMSVQTLTTVGYGSLYPNSPGAWVLAAVEGVFGILGFSLISAVIYARFARPTAKISYSDKALITPFKDGYSIQLRLANQRSTLLSEIEARLLLVMAEVDEQGERLNYYNLKLQFDRVSFLPLSWTVVHPIGPESALAGLSHADLVERRAEMILIIKGIDEGFMQQILTRRSFRYDEIVWGGKYVRAFRSKDGSMQLDLAKLSEYTPVEVPERMPT